MKKTGPPGPPLHCPAQDALPGPASSVSPQRWSDLPARPGCATAPHRTSAPAPDGHLTCVIPCALKPQRPIARRHPPGAPAQSLDFPRFLGPRASAANKHPNTKRPRPSRRRLLRHSSPSHLHRTPRSHARPSLSRSRPDRSQRPAEATRTAPRRAVPQRNASALGITLGSLRRSSPDCIHDEPPTMTLALDLHCQQQTH